MIVSPCFRQHHHLDNVSHLPSNMLEWYGLEEIALFLGIDSPVIFSLMLAPLMQVFCESV